MFHARLKLIAAAILLGMVVILLRLGQMQVVMPEYYREEGRKRQIKLVFPDAPRGTIAARDGTVLAQDQPVLSVCVVLKDYDDLDDEEQGEWRGEVARLAMDSQEGVRKRLLAARRNIDTAIQQRRSVILGKGEEGDKSVEKVAATEERFMRKQFPRRPEVIYEDVEFETAARFEAATADLPGLVVTESMKRKYPQGRLAAHILGYMGEITGEEWDLYRFDYQGDERKRVFYHDVMGRAGMERRYNFELRGRRGRREELRNAAGQRQKILSEEPSEPGRELVLSIDPAMQAVAEEALREIFESNKKAGAAVCMDVHTGEVLVMASSPGYNANTIKEEFAQLNDAGGLGKHRPLYNRAVRGGYPAGSVFKVVTATAGLETGAIDAETTFRCEGKTRIGGKERYCWIGRAPYFGGHGRVSLLSALMQSCNVYFYNVGEKSGGQALVEWAARYGFGKPAGIDLPIESGGNLEITRYPGEAVNLSIGQGSLMVTPLQVCRMMAAVANGGKLVRPKLWRGAQGEPARRVGISEENLRLVRQGLYDVVNERKGTGYKYARSEKLVIAGKTGTAQAGDRGGDHAWFAGYAPYEGPEIAFAIVVEHGGHGGHMSGPVAKRIAETWFEERRGQ